VKLRLVVLGLLLVGMTAGASAKVFDDFEDGDIAEYTGDTGAADTSTFRVFEGTFSGFVKALSADNNEIERDFSSTPRNISYYTKVRVGSSNKFAQGRFTLVDGSGNELVQVGVEPGSNLNRFSYCPDEQALETGNPSPTKWHDIEILGINYNDGTVDEVKANGTTLFSNLNFCSGNTGTPSDIELKANGEATHKAYFDDITTSISKPNVESTTVSPDPPLIGQTADFSYTASDSDGTVTSVDLTLRDDGTTVFTGSKSSASGTFSPPNQLTKGDITAEFTATNNKGATNTTTLTRTLSDNPPSVQVLEPTDLKNTKTPAFNVSVDSTGDSEPNEQVTVELFKDGAKFDTRTITGKGFISGSASFDSEGSHSFKAVASENAGSNQDSSTFTVDTTPPGIQILQPDGKTNDTQGIPLKFQAKDAVSSVDTYTFEYAKDGGTRISTAGNTTIDYGTTGQHTVTVFAQDQAGNEGQTTKTFTADIKNTLTANTATANTQIDTFTATFSNATDTLTKNTTNGQLNFFTTELPKGQVTVTVNSPGFEAANQTLSGVDSTFNQDLNLDLKRAGFTFNAFNEQKPKEELDPRTVTLSNSTTNKQLNKTVNTQYGDVSFTLEENTGDKITCCPVEDGSGPTFFDQNKPGITTKEITVLTETQNNEIDDANAQLTFFINGGQIQEDAFFNSTADVKLNLDEPVKINSLRITGEAADSQTTNGEISTEIENVRFKPPQKGEVSADFKLLKNQGFPTGDVDVKVEAPGFQTRNYNTQIDSSTKTTLNTFLLPQNQGIQPSIEVRDGQQNRLENAQATVLRELGSKGTKTVAQAETATDGTAAFFLDPDVTYTLLVKKQGFGTFRGSFNPTSYEFEPLRIRLKTSSNFTESTVWDKVDFRLQPEQGTVNRTGRTEFNFSVSDPENELTQAGIKIFVDGRKVNETTVTGSSTGLSTTLSQNITGLNVSQGDNLRARGFFVKNQELEAVERNYNVLNRLDAGPFSLSKLTNTFNQGSTNITQGIIGLLILAAAGTGLNTRVGRTGGGLVTLGILGALTFLGWFTPITFLVSRLVTVGVVARG